MVSLVQTRPSLYRLYSSACLCDARFSASYIKQTGGLSGEFLPVGDSQAERLLQLLVFISLLCFRPSPGLARDSQ